MDDQRPLLIDFFCGAGGMSKGFYEAGFRIIGVDHKPQPNYPYPFVQDDVFAVVSLLLSGRYLFFPDEQRWVGRGAIDVAHFSPPCQAYGDLQKQSKRDYPMLIGPTRDAAKALGVPYVIENTEGAPLIDPIVLCGTMFPPLRVIRHRLFESSIPLSVPAHPKHPLVFTHDKRKGHYGKLDQDTSFVQVTGGGNCTVANKRVAMGVPWMTGAEANEAIPPPYAEHIGRQVLGHLERAGRWTPSMSSAG